MQLRNVTAGISLICLLVSWGCSAPLKTKQKGFSSVDMGALTAQIEKPAAASSALDVAEQKDVQNGDVPKVRDLGDAAEKQNPYLRDLAAPEKSKVPEAAEGEGILLNFDNADIYEVIQVIGETLGMNYIVDPQVKGVVNIRSGKKIPIEQLPIIFRKLLNINGLDIKQEGKYDYIHVAKKISSRVVYGPEEAAGLAGSPQVVIQVIPIMHLSSIEAQKLIEPYSSEQGSIYNVEATNTLIISDFESNVVDALTLLSRLDISPLSSLKVRLVRVDNAPLFELRDELEEIFEALQINKRDFEGVSVVPLERVNSLLLVSGNESLIDSAGKWITELDVVPMQGRDNIYIYNVRNSVASELAELVNSLISENTAERPAATTPSRPQPEGEERAQAPEAERPVAVSASRSRRGGAGRLSSSLQFTGQPVLIADDGRNVILLRAMPADYSRLMKLLERLDNLPRQVLIEVMVAEVKLNDSWKFGVEWALKDTGLNVNHLDYTQTFTTSYNQVLDNVAGGFTYSVVNSTERFIGLLNALADTSDVSILSSPQVMVLNNETATVNVGQEVPIVTTETLNDESGGNNTRTIQYRDTGIILTVTPRINYNGIIILDIDQQVSEALTENTTSGIDSPVILNRQLKTKLAVKDGQSILMGGLIEKKTEAGENGVPYAKDIPLMGWLFKYQSETNRNTELLIMITPYVIESEDVLDQYIREFKKKMNDLREKLTGESAL